MDFKEVIWIVVIFGCIACVIGNEGVQLIPRCNSAASRTNWMYSGENCEANGYKVLHDFNFPDVTYPTTALESCQPFYFNSNGLDAIVGPFSSDVQSNYRSLLSPNENKIKDVSTKKSIVADNTYYQTSFSNVTIHNNESENGGVLKSVRKLFEKYVAKNHIDPELNEILSILFDDNAKDSSSSELNVISSVIAEPVQLLDEIMGSNLTTSESNDENMTESIEQLIDRLSEQNIMNTVIEELKQLLDKNIDNTLRPIESSKENTTETIIEFPPTNIINSDNIEPFTNNTSSKNIQLEIELTKEDIEYLLLNGTTDTTDDSCHSTRNINDHCIDVKSSISHDIYTEPVERIDTVLIPELVKLPQIELKTKNFNNSLFNEDSNINTPDSDQIKSYQSEKIYKVVNDTINLNSSTIDLNSGNSINTDEVSFNIPKEPVVFDVVYRDAYNLETPVLDVVPSSIPVRLKINIEIIKHDSNEIDDFYKPNLNSEQFAPKIYENNNVEVNKVKNSIENTEEELAPEEQITVLDEINESDFINALSILLLDSLNNNPLEIIPPEFINSENNSCNPLMEYSSESANNILAKNITLTKSSEKEKIESEDILPVDNVLVTESNIVKYNTSPLIEILRTVINANQSEDDYKFNNTDKDEIDELASKNIFSENQNTFTETQDFIPLSKANSFGNFKETDNVSNVILSITTDADTTSSTPCPLIDVFQLKICPSEIETMKTNK